MRSAQPAQTASPWTDADRAILSNVERCLAGGLALKRWWEQTEASNAYHERFDLTRAFNRPDTSFGFFDVVELEGSPLPIIGIVEDMLYDRAKHSSSRRLRDELREFALRYFLRISDYREPQATFEATPHRAGFGYSQHYYKLRETGFVGKFPESEQFAITDLRTIGQEYRWIVARVQIFDFTIAFNPLGAGAPGVVVPLNEDSYLVLTRDFITDHEAPAPGVLGEYGFGYAFVSRMDTPGVLAYGPSHFQAAFKLIQFRLLDNGETRVRMAFAANRPERILNVSLNPIDWTLRMADLMSFGLAASLLGPFRNMIEGVPGEGPSFDPLAAFTNREWVEKRFLLQHFQQHYQMIIGSLLTWRQIPNWLDSAALPEWVRTGVTA